MTGRVVCGLCAGRHHSVSCPLADSTLQHAEDDARSALVESRSRDLSVAADLSPDVADVV